MGRRASDLTGARFGDLVVVSREASAGKSVAWSCLCDCGRATSVYGQNLRTGSVRSCGCNAHPAKHGASGTRIYQTWASMFARCNSPSYHARRAYAGKGIFVCVEWHDFPAFQVWAESNGYRDDLTIDRIDSSKPYEPENCRFVTAAEQQRNKTNHRLLTHAGRTLTLTEWAEETRMAKNVLHNRLSRGWTIERAITTPVRGPL